MIKLKITHVKVKPLLPQGSLDQLDVHKVLRSLQRDMLKRIRSKILQEAFSERAKRALTRGVSIKVGPRSITVVARHPAFRPLLQGQRQGQMTWLTKARRPIPIVLDDGTLIFRSATARSMKNGKWIHPGRKPTTVLERARVEARQLIKERLSAELRRQIRGAFQL